MKRDVMKAAGWSAAALVLGASLAAPGIALAQQVDDQAQPAVEDEIVVTARLRSESVQDVGQSIDVLSGQALAEQGIESFSDIIAATPGLTAVDRGPGRSMPAIRGIASVIIPQDILQQPVTVSQFLDEVPTSSLSASQFSIPLYDLNRVEVLKGPQPTFFGEGALGGSIRYFSRDPSLTEAGGRARAEVSSTDGSGGLNYVVDGSVGGPVVVDRFGLRLTAWTSQSDGFIDNVTTGEDDVNSYEASGVSLVGLLRSNEMFSWRASILYQDASGDGDPIVDGNPEDLRIGTQFPFAGPNPQTSDEALLFSNKFMFDFGHVRLENVSGYFHRNYDRFINYRVQSAFTFPVLYGVVGGYTSGPVNTEDTTFSNDFRVITDFDGPLNFVGGIYYADTSTNIVQRFDSPQFPALPGSAGTLYYNADADLQGTQWSYYGELQLSVLNNRLRLSAGGRQYTQDQQSISDGSILFPFGPGAFGYLSLATNFQNEANEFLPRFQVEYDFQDNVLLYASAAKGARNGAINSPAVIALAGPAAAPFATYDGDSLWAYEVGVKSEWLNGRLTANAAYSLADWRDIQTSFTLAGFGAVLNGGDARSETFEFDLRYAVNDAFSWYLSGDFTKAEFQETVDIGGGNFIIPGDRLSQTPEIKFSLGGEYRAVGALSFADPVLRASVSHVGDQVNVIGVVNTPKIEALTLVDLQLGLSNDSWSAFLYVDNAFNEIQTVYDSSIIVGGVNFLPEFSVNRPRTIGVVLRREF